MLQGDRVGIEFVRDLASLPVNSAHLLLNLVDRLFDLLGRDVVFVRDGLALEPHELDHTVPLPGHDLDCQSVLLKLICLESFFCLIFLELLEQCPELVRVALLFALLLTLSLAVIVSHRRQRGWRFFLLISEESKG